MVSFLKPASLEAKLRGMNAANISDEDFEKIAKLECVNDVVNYLKNHKGYENLLEKTTEAFDREKLERFLSLPLYRTYLKIYNFSSDKDRKFLKIYTEMFEITLLKVFFHIVFGNFGGNYKVAFIKEEIDFFNNYTCLDILKLNDCNSYVELLESIKDTNYYTVLKTLSSKKNITPFDIDILLDNFHFQNVVKIAKKFLDKKSYAKFRKSYGEYIDLKNISWIYRGKKIYNLNEIDLYSIILPIQTHLNREVLSELVSAKTEEDLNNILSRTYYKKFFKKDGIKLVSENFDKLIEKAIYQPHIKETDYVSIVMLFFHKKQLEKVKLIKTIEAIRYHMNPKDIW